MSTYDAVVVGAGPNGLVAANHLADAGWSVLVVEAQPEPGGAVRSDRELHPDFVHDTCSAFYPLGAASPVLRGLELEKFGLAWRHAPAVLGHPFPDGSWALQERDREATAARLDAAHSGDGEAWLTRCREWDAIGEHVVGALLSPFPPVRHSLGAAARLRSVGGLDYVKMLLTPAAELGETYFGGPAPQILLAGNAGHADIPLAAPGSGLLGYLLTMLAHTVGFPVPEGGAGRLTDALVRRLRAGGGEIACSEPVTGIEVRNGRPTAVRTPARSIGVRHAVLADVNAQQLYGDLLADHVVPSRVRRGMRSFRMDPGTVKVDWALDGPVPWESPPDVAPGTVHVSDSLAQMVEALSQVAAGGIPADPFLLTGQMTTADPTRSPAGTESMWAYTHVPQRTTHDVGDGGVRGVWDRDDCERFADRMQARIEARAPGFGSRVISRRILGPRELEARNANLVGGAVGGGTSQLHQQLVFRPVPGLGRAETGVRGVYLASSSAHPGGAVHGACGMNAARAALAHRRVGRLVPVRR
ncbi:MAG TPA: NAD(P)/FAD-dependent oxidoreductase [Marmoricola sp.]|nr:NAD(P)/FAD-dependent oxidoreductase [Marmoricola sp.]